MMPKGGNMFNAGAVKVCLNLEYCNYCYDNGVLMKSDSIYTAKAMQ